MVNIDQNFVSIWLTFKRSKIYEAPKQIKIDHGQSESILLFVFVFIWHISAY